jgi:hypothetical protein
MESALPPFSFSDSELDAVMNLAAPLPAQNRNRFLETIAAELQARGGEVGPGAVHRIARELQSHFLYVMPSIKKNVARSRRV